MSAALGLGVEVPSGCDLAARLTSCLLCLLPSWCACSLGPSGVALQVLLPGVAAARLWEFFL